MFATEYESPFGKMTIVENNNAISGLTFFKLVDPIYQFNETPLLSKAKNELDLYFAHKLTKFTLPIHPVGTDFQKKIWNLVMDIPYATVASYKEIAMRYGSPSSSRAVGMAMHLNPILILIPCHRVVGASGKLIGYAAGLEIKKRLLELEKEC